MTHTLGKIGLGGGCHWCTEAVFQSLSGVCDVQSGWVASDGEHSSDSEAVIVHFNPDQIALETLIEIHLLTHSSAADHSMRSKYRSAVYVFSTLQAGDANEILATLAERHDTQFITRALPYRAFRAISDAYKNYYYTAPERPFCVNIIEPKLKQLIATHRKFVDPERLATA